MKKILIRMLAFIMAFGCLGLVACKKEDNGKISVVCTIFSEYDWVNNILGDQKDKFKVTLLMDSGADLHNYSPTVKDTATICECDLFIYTGGESDEWVNDVMKNPSINDDMVSLNLLEILGDKAKNEEPVDEEEHEHSDEKDEHIWLSLKNAYFLCDKICEQIIKLDNENSDIYESNLSDYKTKILNLDNEYETAVSNAKYTTLVFADRFPFRYLLDDYGLSYYAAFSGCSTEINATPSTITRLAQKVDEFDLPVICTIEGKKHDVAESVKNSTKAKNQTIVSFDSMQSVNLTDINNGTTYLSIMQKNLNRLKTAIGVIGD